MPGKRITSPANPHIKELLKIKSRPSAGSFLIEGPHLVISAVQSAAAIREVCITPAFASSEDSAGLLRQLPEKTRIIREVSEAVMKRLSDTETPQGIMALVAEPVLRLVDLAPGVNPLIAVVEGVQDPGNLGTIIRIADASGADVVIVLHGSCDPYSPKAVRATAGSIFNIPLIRSRTDEFLDWLRLKRIALAVTAADGETPVFGARLTGPLAFAFGSEAHGISLTLREAADMIISIPIYGRAESLNVATAAAVCLYEAVRQRKGPEHTA